MLKQIDGSRVVAESVAMCRPEQTLSVQLRLLQGLRHLRLGMSVRGDQDGAGGDLKVSRQALRSYRI